MSAAPSSLTLHVTDNVPSNSQHQQSETAAQHSTIKTETINASPITQSISNSAVIPPFNATVSTATQNNDSSSTLLQNNIESNTETSSNNNGKIEQSLPQFQQRNTSRTFFRAPGLEAPDESSGDFPTNAFVCQDCGFSCSSKFHYNSHRNTHSTHQCPICKFETRTEGRLKKHMLQSHKREQRLAAGINIHSPPPTPTALKQNSPPSNNELGVDKCLTHQQIFATHGISSDGINLFNSVLTAGTGNNAAGSFALDSLQSMLNNTNSTDAILKICTEAITSNGTGKKPFSPSHNQQQVADLGHVPLDQLRALTERHPALSTTSMTSSLNIGDLQIGPEASSLIGSDSNHPQTIQQSGEGKQHTPRRSGKPKQYKCKTCQNISCSKTEHWAHSRQHIPKQKQLTCSLCDFVTEYKHHLEYHYRNHNGQKPFKCSICDYTCVNKSMLNSHMKSHTPVYQFRCQDCTYQTKYCHSLKMHLKKYNHKRAPGPNGFVDSSDSHGEERPENASSSSIGREDTASFENGASLGAALQSDGHSEGTAELIGALPSAIFQHLPLLNGPLLGAPAELELTSHRLLLQQQVKLEQMNGFIRNAVVSCPHCSFSTGNIDEMNKHLLFHLIVTQQPMPTALSSEQHSLASIYQRLTAQLHQELIPASEEPVQPMISPPQSHRQNATNSVLSHDALSTATIGSHNQQQRSEEVPIEVSLSRTITSDKDGEEKRLLGRESVDDIHLRSQLPQGDQHIQFTPTTVTEMLAAVAHPLRNDLTASTCIDAETESARGGGCTTDGTSTTTPASNTNEQSTNNNTQQIPYSPTNKSLKRDFPFGGTAFHSSRDGASALLTQEQLDRGQSCVGEATETCVITNVIPRLVGSIPELNNGFEARTNAAEEEVSAGTVQGYGNISANFSGCIQGPSGTVLPFFCQQCEIAFKDAVSCTNICVRTKNPMTGNDSLPPLLDLSWGPNVQRQNVAPPMVGNVPLTSNVKNISNLPGVLYQVHRGFHARENMFKCNICGHLSTSSLEFNLHLYQAKHE